MQETVDSPWAVLGLDEGATLAEVRRAFRARAKTTHPDHGGSRSEFEALRAAFEAARRVAADRADAAGPRQTGTASRPAAAPPAPPLNGPHVSPAPSRVVHAYDWATASAARSGVARRRPRPHRMGDAAPGTAERPSFATVLQQEMARLAVPA